MLLLKAILFLGVALFAIITSKSLAIFSTTSYPSGIERPYPLSSLYSTRVSRSLASAATSQPSPSMSLAIGEQASFSLPPSDEMCSLHFLAGLLILNVLSGCASNFQKPPTISTKLTSLQPKNSLFSSPATYTPRVVGSQKLLIYLASFSLDYMFQY